MINKYRKKSVIIEAAQFTNENKDQVMNWVDCNCYPEQKPDSLVLVIETLEGDMTARIGDWIIKGVNGEFYPCKNDIFKKTYEPVKDGE